MKLLLDSHALLWWVADDARLGSRVRALVAAPQTIILASVVSIWELIIKVRVGKLAFDVAELEACLERGGFTMLSIRPAHLRTLVTLPKHHGDPYDHMLIAQAIAEDAILVSQDRIFAAYPVEVMTCTDPADRR